MAHASRPPFIATTCIYVVICIILLLIGLIPFWGFPFLIIGGIGLPFTPFVALLMMEVHCPHCGKEEMVMPRNSAYTCGRCQKRVLIKKTVGGYETIEP